MKFDRVFISVLILASLSILAAACGREDRLAPADHIADEVAEKADQEIDFLMKEEDGTEHRARVFFSNSAASRARAIIDQAIVVPGFDIDSKAALAEALNHDNEPQVPVTKSPAGGDDSTFLYVRIEPTGDGSVPAWSAPIGAFIGEDHERTGLESENELPSTPEQAPSYAASSTSFHYFTDTGIIVPTVISLANGCSDLAWMYGATHSWSQGGTLILVRNGTPVDTKGYGGGVATVNQAHNDESGAYVWWSFGSNTISGSGTFTCKD